MPKIYVDADWGGDLATGRSTTGWITLLGGGAISWHSRLQREVASSTMEAEYIAMGEAIREARFQRNLATELDYLDRDQAITIYGDNAAALAYAQGNHTTKRSKHIRLAHHIVKEAVERKEIDLAKVDSISNVADLLTKPLGKTRLEDLRMKSGVKASSDQRAP